jgi:hypothetical protein
MFVLLAKSLIQATPRLDALHRSMRRNGLPCLLIEPNRRRLLELCSLGIKPRLAGHLFATLETCHIPQRDYLGQGRDGTDPGLRHEESRSRVFMRHTLNRLVQHFTSLFAALAVE